MYGLVPMMGTSARIWWCSVTSLSRSGVPPSCLRRNPRYHCRRPDSLMMFRALLPGSDPHGFSPGTLGVTRTAWGWFTERALAAHSW